MRWASKKAGGSTKNTKNKTRGKRLGLKCGDGEHVGAGSVLVRQRGTAFYPGLNVSSPIEYMLCVDALHLLLGWYRKGPHSILVSRGACQIYSCGKTTIASSERPQVDQKTLEKVCGSDENFKNSTS